ncbi:DUF5343 domain-containing protein [Chryseobacterium geocarposphaerae]|uniref:DUF5343 domain-containing protein n=1 Tax=Chryseobacterium geocarposphaerae TaxID=1416776 RepID=A0A2M9C5R9_9FLAO|nr:DUF5343 domain-containing protein [Chryseobacterium geocarposphaerae]PJJ66162.1 hypothetical protein CLV73_0128 [Chryseobacterium geocarposphaerae]
MGINLAYMSSPGTLPKILNKICEAVVPDNFNGDFLGTKLGFKGGNQKSFISWAKKCGFLNSDGTPTQLYKNFRNPSSRSESMAQALRKGYSDAFERNEYANELDKKNFTKLISEITGAPHDNSTVKFIVSSFFLAKEYADFEKESTVNDDIIPSSENNLPMILNNSKQNNSEEHKIKKVNLGLSYTINLVLPKTEDPAIYNAIFKSLKENLLNE